MFQSLANSNRLFRVFLSSQEDHKAAVLVKRLLETHPTEASVYNMAGDLARSQGNLTEAIGHYRVAINRSSENAHARRALGFLEPAHSGAPKLNGVGPSPFYRLADFLPSSLHKDLVEFVAGQEHSFVTAGVGENRYRHTSFSSSLESPIRELRTKFLSRLEQAALSAQKLPGFPSFSIGRLECKLTSYGLGGSFPAHRDNVKFPERLLSYVYVVALPNGNFSGGDFYLYDGDCKNERWDRLVYTCLKHTDNVLTVFPSSCLHELRPVMPATPSFIDRRFAITGHIRLAESDSD